MKRTFVLIFAMLILYVAIGYADTADDTLILPSSLTVVEEEAFYGNTSISTVVLPEGITTIGTRAFAGSSVSEINLPDSLTFIDDTAFDGPDKVTVTANEGTYAYEWAVENGYIGGAIPEYTSATSFDYEIINGECIITGYHGEDTVVVVPKVIDTFPVTAIGNHAFATVTEVNHIVYTDDSGQEVEEEVNQYGEGVGIERIVIPSSVRSIGTDAFYNCNKLREIVIPQSTVDIGSRAFAFCDSLASISLPRRITVIEEGTFKGCENLVTVQMEDNVTVIGSYAFSWCSNLVNIVIPNSVSSIGDAAFSECTSLTGITIPKCVANMGSGIFEGCTSLTAITVSPENDAFCSADGVLFDKSMETLIKYPSGKKTEAYSIPGSVTTIEKRAFCSCPYLLDAVLMPASGLFAQDYAFYDVNLRSMLIDGVVDGGDFFFNNNPEFTLYYHDIESFHMPAYLHAYTSFGYDMTDEGAYIITSYSCDIYKTECVIPGAIFGVPVVGIAEDCFEGDSSLRSVIIPDSVMSIGHGAFYECNNLESVILGKGVKSIGVRAFSDCIKIEEITIPDGVTVIETGTFSYCENLHSLSLGQNTVEIKDEAFYGCKSLQSIYIPASVEQIGYNCFYDCAALRSIEVDPGNENYRSNSGVLIGRYNKANAGLSESELYVYDAVLVYPPAKYDSVYYCDSTDGVVDHAFRNCKNLEAVFFTKEDSDVYILENSFENCERLRRVEFAPCDFIMSVANYAFNNCPNLEFVSFADDSFTIGGISNPFKDSGAPLTLVDPGNEKWCIRRGIPYVYAEENTDSDLVADIIQTQPAYGQMVEVDSEIKVTVTAEGGDEPLEYNYVLLVDGNFPIASGWKRNNTHTFTASKKGIYSCFAVIRDSKRNRCLTNEVFGIIGGESKVVSGILRQGEGWAIGWQIAYDEDDQGNKMNAQLSIYLSGNSESEGTIDIVPIQENIFQMPWLTDEYGFKKSDFIRIDVYGGYMNKLQIISNTFKDYTNVDRVRLSNVNLIQGHAFEGCTGLKSVYCDSPLSIVGPAAFKNCTQLATFSITSGINRIEDEAFRNTMINTFKFSETVEIGDYAFSDSNLTGEYSLSKVERIGNYAFSNNNTARVTLGKQVREIGEGAFTGCDNLVIECLYDSYAYWYAKNNGIRYELLITHSLPLEYYLQNDSTQYDHDLALITAELSNAAYGGGQYTSDLSIRNILYEYGFQDDQIYSNYGGSNSYFSGSFQYVIATKPFEDDTLENTDIMIVVAQGTKNRYEGAQDLFSGHGTHTVLGLETYDVAWDFYHDITEGKERDNISGIWDIVNPDKNYKVLLTGHSLGGAAINLVAAELTNRFYGKNNVYCYTYGAIDPFPSSSNIVNGYENIHNVYNLADTFAPDHFGADNIASGMMKMYGKFGVLDTFDYDWRDSWNGIMPAPIQIIQSVNHAMEKYVEAVKCGFIDS